MTHIQRLAAGAAIMSGCLAVASAVSADDGRFLTAQFEMTPRAALDGAPRVQDGAIQRIVAGGGAMGEPLRARGEAERFYAMRGGAAAWVERGRLSDDARDLIGVLQNAGEHGLHPDAYHLRALSGPIDARGRVAAEAEHAVDALLTDAFLAYGRDMLYGRVDPSALHDDVEVAPESRDLAALLAAALDRRQVTDALRALEPAHPQYRMLLAAHARYRELADRVAWPAVDDGGLLRPGDRDARVAQIRARLDAEDAFDGQQTPVTPAADDSLLYDETLEARVKAFQRRHRLADDGIVGADTLAMLNQGLAQRAETILINLERWRWLPNDPGGRYILVNAPQYRLRGYENGRESIAMDVIVGRESRRTPQFSDMMEHLVVNPNWNVPYSIATTDKLPKLRSDPGYFDRLGYAIFTSDGRRVSPHAVNWNTYSRGNFPFRLVQTPGPANALGTIKFMFPNPYNVYLHDTDSPDLFDEEQRSMSSGCVRVSDPRALARWIAAGDPALDMAEIEAAWESSETKTLVLGEQIPVHLAYFTAWAEEGGATEFFGDIYGRDRALAASLSGAS